MILRPGSVSCCGCNHILSHHPMRRGAYCRMIFCRKICGWGVHDGLGVGNERFWEVGGMIMLSFLCVCVCIMQGVMEQGGNVYWDGSRVGYGRRNPHHHPAFLGRWLGLSFLYDFLHFSSHVAHLARVLRKVRGAIGMKSLLSCILMILEVSGILTFGSPLWV
jgi:hypothetical protein